MKALDKPAPDQADGKGANQHEGAGHGDLPEEKLNFNDLGVLYDKHQEKE
jgi:hypothetical protein